MVAPGFLIKFCILTIVLQISTQNAIEFVVSEYHGTDDIKCLNGYMHCRTIDYVYNHVMNSMNSSLAEVQVRILGRYHLNNTLFINKTSHVVKHLKFVGNASSIIVPINNTINIVVGVKHGHLDYKLTFENLTFEFFGFHVPAVLTTWFIDILIHSCDFRNNSCSALNTHDSSIEILDSVFYNNTGSAVYSSQVYDNLPMSFSNGNYSAGGAVAIIFSESHKKNVVIKNNVFQWNMAICDTGKNKKGNIISSLSHMGGGLLLAFLAVSSSMNVLIESNIFDSNKASRGGGIMFAFADKSGYNRITVTDALITRNIGSVTGGGFAMAAWGQSNKNCLNITGTNISHNNARVGGGGKVMFESYDLYLKYEPATNYVSLESVVFFANKAFSSSGLHLIYNLALSSKPVAAVKFYNVSFCHNFISNSYGSNDAPSAFSGVLLSNRVDVQFEKSSYFLNNSMETPMYLSNAEIRLKGSLTFLHNKVQTYGGGMTLTDVSSLHLSAGSMLLFQENFAHIGGGAMYIRTIGFPDLVYEYNPSCFIQYVDDPHLPPSLWNTSIRFIKNGAGLKGAAILTNTITPCIWINTKPYFSFKKALRWGKNFFYQENYLSGLKTFSCNDESNNDDIATDTTRYSIDIGKHVAAAPGDQIKFDIKAFDELKNSVYSVPVASLSSGGNLTGNHLSLANNYFIIQPNQNKSQYLRYKVTTEGYEEMKNDDKMVQTIQFTDSYSSFLSNASFTIRPVVCRPGFTYRDGVCVCDTQNSHLERCDEDLIVYITEGYWADVGNHGKLELSKCPPNYCACKRNNTRVGCAFNYKNQNLQCAKGREGVLCGQCKDNYGVDILTLECVRCDSFPWSTVMLAVVGTAVIVTAVLILILNPKFSSHMRGILFFVQMLPYVLDRGNSVNKVILAATSWLDLGGINSVSVGGCFANGFSSLYAIIINYMYPVLIFIVLLVLYTLHKFYLVTFRRNSPFQSFWILIVAMYKFLVETSLLLLFCVHVKDRYVFFYDGNIECYRDSHLIVTVIASAVLLLLVIPPPVLVPLTVFGYVSFGPIIADALSQGLRKHVRWWWSVDFIRRIVFIAVYVFIPDWTVKQTALIICCILMLAVHMQMQPYRNKHANMGESFLLICLALLTTVNTSPKSLPKSFQTVVASVAALYIVLLTLYLTVVFFAKLCKYRGYFQIEEKDDETDDDEIYGESIKRRMNVSSLNEYDVRHSPVSRVKREKRRGVVPSPTYLRSDLKETT